LIYIILLQTKISNLFVFTKKGYISYLSVIQQRRAIPYILLFFPYSCFFLLFPVRRGEKKGLQRELLEFYAQQTNGKQDKKHTIA